MRKSTEDLAKCAATVLQQNDNEIERAIPKFDAILKKDNGLRHALLFDYLSARLVQDGAPPPKPRKPIKVVEHRRAKPRSPEERSGELMSAEHHGEIMRSVFEHRVNNRPIGEFRWGELTLAVAENAHNAASYLQLGTEATANALLLDKIFGHAVVDNHETLVAEILSPKQLQNYLFEARKEAPVRIEAGMRHYAASLASAEVAHLLEQTP